MYVASVLLTVSATFILAALIDILYIGWLYYAGDADRPARTHAASMCTALIGLCGILGTWIVIKQSALYIVPDLLGLYVGTYVGIKNRNYFEQIFRK